MERSSHEHVIGIPVTSKAYGIEELPGEATALQDSHPYGSFSSKQDMKNSAADRTTKIGKKGNNFAQGIKEHVTLGPKLSETVKGKLSLGARILQAGGVENVFRQSFSIEKGERLLKASQCYLSTTAGPIAGMLFISTEKIAFRSDRSLALTSPSGDTIRLPYKVVIPLRRIKKAKPSENVNKPEQKYVQIVTADDFEFWFMGFVSYERSFKHLEQAIARSQ